MKNRRLYRSEKERVLGGIAGGLAEYFGVDPIIMRLVFLALLFSGIGFVLYIIAWIFIPSK